jgi:hypothetical protein
VVRTDCRRFRLCSCVIVIFICESSVLGEDWVQGIYTMFCVIVIFICESSDRGEERLQEISTMFVCDCDIYV